VGIGGEFPHLSRKALTSPFLPFTTSYLCNTGFSAVAAVKAKYISFYDELEK
jgi:hypothetical protein